MTRILLVNSKVEEATTLASGFKSLRADWQILVTDNVKDCISRVHEQTIDCLIIDTTTLVGPASEDLVKKSKTASPATVLILLGHESAEAAIFENSRADQRNVDKEVSIDRLEEIIERSLQLQKALSNPALSTAVSQIKHLPTLPAIYKKLADEVSAKNSSAYSVSLIIETDSALSASVLRVVNSAFYGLSKPVESVSQAVSLLGVHMIKNITLTTKVFSQFAGNNVDQKRLEANNDTANRLGALSHHFARLAGVPREMVDQAQIAGMLDGVGELILLSEPGLRKAGDEATQATLLSAYLLRFWLMPEAIVESIALKHQSPRKPCTVIDPLIISFAIHYLDKHLAGLDAEQQRQKCKQYLAQFVPDKLARQWIQAFCDVNQLVARTDSVNGTYQ